MIKLIPNGKLCKITHEPNPERSEEGQIYPSHLCESLIKILETLDKKSRWKSYHVLLKADRSYGIWTCE